MDLARVERLRREAEETRRRDDQEMSLAVRRAFFASPVFPLALKGVVAYLLTFEDRGEALPTVVQAARESGITERHMTTQFATLKHLGILQLQRHYGAGGSVYAPIDLTVVLSDAELQTVLRPVTNLDALRTPKPSSGMEPKKPEANFGDRPNNPEGAFRNDFPENTFGVQNNDDRRSSRRRSSIKETTTDRQSRTTAEENHEDRFSDPGPDNAEGPFRDGRPGNPEAGNGDRDLRIARDDEGEIRRLLSLLCEFCGPMPFAKLHPLWNPERLTEALDHYDYLVDAGVKDPATYMRLALEKGWAISTKQRAAKRKKQRQETPTSTAQSSSAIVDDTVGDADAELFTAMSEADAETQKQIRDLATRTARAVFGREFSLEHPAAAPHLKAAIRRVMSQSEARPS